MAKYRDCFGNLYFEMVRPKDKAKYYVNHGENKICKKELWYNTDACQMYGEDFWEDIPRFNSFIRAVRYLKENIDSFL